MVRRRIAPPPQKKRVDLWVFAYHPTVYSRGISKGGSVAVAVGFIDLWNIALETSNMIFFSFFFFFSFNFLQILLGFDFIIDTICTRQENRCLPYAGFFFLGQATRSTSENKIGLKKPTKYFAQNFLSSKGQKETT